MKFLIKTGCGGKKLCTIKAARHLSAAHKFISDHVSKSGLPIRCDGSMDDTDGVFQAIIPPKVEPPPPYPDGWENIGQKFYVERVG